MDDVKYSNIKCKKCGNCTKVCVFCSTKKSPVNNCRMSLQHGRVGGQEQEELLKNIEKTALATSCISKIVTLATENSFMPLLQQCLLFPDFIRFIGKEPCKPENIDVFFKNNWRLIVISISIVTSLISLSWSVTTTYFSKPGKESYKTIKRMVCFFFSILFSIVPKLFAYELFAFGVIGRYCGVNWIIPFLLGTPIILSFVFTMFQSAMFQSESMIIYDRRAILSKLSSIFVYIGLDFLWTEGKETRDKLNHILYDLISFFVVTSMTMIGVVCIDEKELDTKRKLGLTVAILWLYSFGLLLKLTFYTYLHPWTKLNQKLAYFKSFKLFHKVTCVTFITLTILGTGIMAHFVSQTTISIPSGEFLKQLKIMIKKNMWEVTKHKI